MHSLLKRQLRRHFGEGNPPPLQCAGFISAVNTTYEQSDIDREMLERSLELSSLELLQANSELRIRNTELEASLAELRQVKTTLSRSEKMASVGSGTTFVIRLPL